MKSPLILREYISQTGIIPDGLQLIRDTIDFKPLDIRRSTARSPFLEEKGTQKILNVIRCSGVFQRADTKNANGRIYPYEILREAVERLQKPIKERQIMGEFDHCLTSPDFRVLTVSGWKNFRDVKVDEFVYSRVNGKMIQSKVKAIVDMPYNGLAYKFEGRHINSSFTPAHRIIMDTRHDRNHTDRIRSDISRQVEATTEEIFKNRRQYNHNLIPRKAEWIGKDSEVYIIPGLNKSELHNESDEYYKNAQTEPLQINTKTFVSFLGLWLAEGSLVSNTGIYIHQVKEDYKPIIREMLNGFPNGLKWTEGDTYFYLADKRLRKYLEQFGDAYNKFIPTDVKELDAPFLAELVYWHQVGDGRLKHGRNSTSSVSKRLIDDLHECWIKSGGCGYLTTIIAKYDYEFCNHIVKVENIKPLYQLTLSDTEGIYMDDRFLKISQFNHNGNIYCLETEYGNFYMEQDGCSFWTGNSPDAKIHMDRVSHLISRLWWEDKTVLGEIEVINDMRCPCGSNLACFLDWKIRVGISSRGVGDMELVEHDGEDAYQVSPGFEFITFDSVAEPSVFGTQLNIMESRNKKQVAIEEHKNLIRAKEKLLVEEIKKNFLS